MNLTECEIRSVLFMGLMVEWKSGTLHGSSFEDINYFGSFSREIVVIYDKFSFDLDFLILEG
jgi:hypothetical protein